MGNTRFLYEMFILLVVLTYAILIFADPVDHPFISERLLENVDLVMIVFFGIEYIVRLVRAKQKLAFIKANWFDLVAMIPMDPHFQLARIMRVLRLFRILHASPLMWSVITSKQMRLIMFFMVLMVAWSSVGIFILESDHHSSINTYGDALWWAIVTMTTVGYGDVSPTTEGGRVIAVFLMFTGIGLIGSFTANLANHWISFFHTAATQEPLPAENRVHEQMKQSAIEWMQRVDQLTEEEYRQLLKVIELLRQSPEDGKNA